MRYCSFKKSSALLTALLVIAITGCKKDEQKTTSAEATPSKSIEALGKLSSPDQIASSATIPLYLSLPKDVAGFFNIDLQGAAFQRLLESKWGKSYLAKTSSLTSQMPDLASVMSEAGMDMSKPEELKKHLSQALVFFTTSETGTEGHGGLIIKSDSEAKTRELFQALKASAEKRSASSANTEDGFTLVMTVPQSAVSAGNGPQQVKKINMKGRVVGDKIIIADDEDLLKKFTNTTEKFESVELAETAEMAGQNSIGLGFVDFKRLKAASKNTTDTLPVKNGIISAQMSDHPTVQIKVAKENSSAAATTSTTSNVILSSIPSDPLFYSVLELGALRELALESSTKAQEAMNDTQLSFLKSIGQIGLGAMVSKEAQAMIPIPELIVAVQTSDANGLIDRLLKSASGAVKGYGLPGTTSDKQIAGKAVKMLQGAMGVNLYAIDLGGVVVAATTEQLIQGAIERSINQGTISNLSATNISELTKPKVAKFYLSFPELAKLLKSAQSMAAMANGAPGQDNTMASALNDENLKSLQELGSLIGSVDSDNQSYSVNFSYN